MISLSEPVSCLGPRIQKELHWRRPPETVTVKDILDIVDDSATQDDKNAGPAADILRRRDQAVQTALDGITLKSLVAENHSDNQ